MQNRALKKFVIFQRKCVLGHESIKQADRPAAKLKKMALYVILYKNISTFMYDMNKYQIVIYVFKS